MNRPLEITPRQVTALCKGPQKAGFIPKLQIGNVFVRLLPTGHPSLRMVGDPHRHDDGSDIRL